MSGGAVAGFRQLAAVAVRAGREKTRRGVDRRLRRGWHARPLDLERDRVVLLFFADVEGGRRTRHLKLAARRIVHASRGGQRVSGFEIAFRGLLRSLEAVGYVPVVDDYALAAANPTYPIGLAGYPHILDHWTLPNPIVLGPGMFDHPSLSLDAAADPRVRSLVMPCQWLDDLFAPVWAGRTVPWYSAIDTAEWPDASGEAKDLDFLVYDKIRWDRDRLVPEVLDPVLAELDRTGARYEIVRYGAYDRDAYRKQLRRTKAMVFVCEHETQGLAYQEAMATGAAILAWDNGFWLDPQRFKYSDDPVPGSSVPFFDPVCGERFVNAAAFPAALEVFRERLDVGAYAPRHYVEGALSFEVSGHLYLDAYLDAAHQGASAGRR